MEWEEYLLVMNVWEVFYGQPKEYAPLKIMNILLSSFFMDDVAYIEESYDKFCNQSKQMKISSIIARKESNSFFWRTNPT